MNLRVKNSRFTPLNMLVVINVVILISVGALWSYQTYSNQVRDVLLNSTNQSAIQNQNLIRAIHESDNIDDNQTQKLLNITLNKADDNFKIVLKALNESNVFIKSLSDNFGEESDYLKRENFQYKQANETFTKIDKTLINVNKALENQARIMSLLNGSGSR